MRLSKIKLSGFKSFVDPTTIPLPSNLIGIVGPNGCGKSNVIDAVRWVMGESSAKNLRGESMADVIFNGSSARKPVGQASVELVFDNSDGTLGGQYAQYSEISVKRVVSRDGQSQYFQNGTRCRRRDITDIFLGTGLGPRSYSIIEQGMISRLIEAKPEELRVFLEEAAGISKYKERRKETESRIRHTRENMDRLNDLREELAKQLDRLQRQSKTAERYKTYKEEERVLKAQLTALRWQNLDSQTKLQESLIKEKETRYEALMADLRQLEAEFERQRDEHQEATEVFNEVQGEFYGVGAEIARVEQSIQHNKERRQQLQDDLKNAERAWIEAQAHLDADQRKLAELSAAIVEYEPKLQIARDTESQSSAALSQAEQAMHEWQAEWQAFNESAAIPAQNAEVERTGLQHLDRQMVQNQQRIERLEEELQRVIPDELARDIEQMKENEIGVAQQCEQFEQQFSLLQETISSARQQQDDVSHQLDGRRSELQSVKGRQASLEALQQAALGKQDQVLSDWLTQQQLDEAKRLAQRIDVETGWHKALECVLGYHLEAVCVADLESLSHAVPSLQQGSISFLEDGEALPVDTGSSLVALLDKVTPRAGLQTLIGHVYCADDLQQALQRRNDLQNHQSIVTRDGVWLGRNWLRINRDSDERAGVIHREQEIQSGAEQIEQLSELVETLSQNLQDVRSQLHEHEAHSHQLQSELKQANRSHSELQARISNKQSRLDQILERRESIAIEQQELKQQISHAESESSAARHRLDEAIKQMEDLAKQREILSAKREQLQTELDSVRSAARSDRDTAHEIALRIETMRTEVSTINNNQERMDYQLQQLDSRKRELQLNLEQSEAPLESLSQELEEYLSRRVEVEAQLNEARRHVESLDHAMRENTTNRHKVEQTTQEVRASLDQTRMAWQEINVRRKTVEESLQETGFDLKTLFEHMPEGASEEDWQQQVDNMAARINRLGPINLAAIDEYQQELERKEYLDAQHEDLTEALQTLENAIQKIDRETRAKFKETFDQVNNGIKNMFPRLFGGGQAYLELTGDDLLDTGVTVMARPPGKRNSSIHLLSGGEKALTAVALVFSIFQLNPAPFCMLDEVDAPLDDANVGRYSNMVEEMSEHVQFIVITHNKITMEMTHQLNGVTMHEPGVSRLVAVDVDQAAEMVG